MDFRRRGDASGCTARQFTPQVSLHWTADLPYLLNYFRTSLQVPSGAQLQIDALVSFSSRSDSSVQSCWGRWWCRKSAAKPVVFTSYHDDSFGGDTDGTTTDAVGERQWWGSIVVSSGGVVICRLTRTFVIVELGVCDVRCRYDELAFGSRVIDNVNTGFGDTYGGSVTVADSTISPLATNGPGTGVQVGTTSSTSPPTSPTITNTTITDANIGIYAFGTATPVVHSATFTRVTHEGFVQTTASGIVMQNTTVTDGVGNIQIYGGPFPSGITRWTADLPYLLNYNGTTYTIPAGGQLQVDPGVIVKWAGSSVQVVGSLVVSGSAAAPVVFTSYHDDSFGGNTDGTSTTPSMSDSAGIVVSSGGVVNLSNMHVRYASCGVCTSGAGTTSCFRGSRSTT